MDERIQIQAQLSEVAWTSRLGAKEIQDVHLCEWLFLARTRRVLQDSEDEQGFLGGEDQEKSGERYRRAEAFGRDGMALHHYLGVRTEAVEKGGNAEIIGLYPQ